MTTATQTATACDWCGTAAHVQALTLHPARGEPARTDLVCDCCLTTVADCPYCHAMFVPMLGPIMPWHPNHWTYLGWSERNQCYTVDCPSCGKRSDADLAGMEMDDG